MQRRLHDYGRLRSLLSGECYKKVVTEAIFKVGAEAKTRSSWVGLNKRLCKTKL